VSGGALIAGAVRLVLIILPVATVARLTVRPWGLDDGPLRALAQIIVGISVTIVGAELLGLAGLDRTPALVALFTLVAVATWFAVRRRPPRAIGLVPVAEPGRAGPFGAGWPVLLGTGVVLTEWAVQTANALGAGMSGFDTLWYHMPIAARFAQTGSVTGIPFTQADPFTAYYPANSELVHALGIVALHGDLLSPLINLGWLGVAMLAAWCIGRPWGAQRLTLLAICVPLSVTVIGVTQPGQAFNDIVGLAVLLAAVAFLVNLVPGPGSRWLIGLALGFAVGTKLTFIVPAAIIVVGMLVSARRGERTRALRLLLTAIVLSSGWWYLRNLLVSGTPLGLRVTLGPIALPGASSVLAAGSQQTIVSQLRNLHLIGSRFIPGLDDGLGPLWSVILVLCFAGGFAGLARRIPATLRVVAATAVVSGVSYLLAPTGATDLAGSSQLFSENLRYAMPALVLGAVLVPVLVVRRRPAWAPLLGPLLALVAVLTQRERSLWPTQTGRHVVAAAAIVALGAAAAAIPRLRRSPARLRWPVAAVAALCVLGAIEVVQRHYFDQRYRTGVKSDPGLTAIYRWAQGVAGARIALYGSVLQYPLYGAFDTNRLTYLGAHTAHGGYVPIGSCPAWRAAIAAGGYGYVVVTPAPTVGIPISWSTGDAALAVVLHPTANDWVFRVADSGGAGTAGCE
jgi:hypothetical protein